MKVIDRQISNSAKDGSEVDQVCYLKDDATEIFKNLESLTKIDKDKTQLNFIIQNNMTQYQLNLEYNRQKRDIGVNQKVNHEIPSYHDQKRGRKRNYKGNQYYKSKVDHLWTPTNMYPILPYERKFRKFNKLVHKDPDLGHDENFVFSFKEYDAI